MLKIAWNDNYQHPLPETHRFPMLKYELIPKQLIHEGIIAKENIFCPKPADEATLLLTHDKNYLYNLREGLLSDQMIRKIGFPWSYELYLREITLVQGTLDCSLFALEHGISFNTAGGTHHAFADSGEGFCLLNDFAVAANYLLHHDLARKILIVDLDVHQGNGTARIFRNDPRVFTFSMHGKHNYPFHKETSTLDVELDDGLQDEAYLALLDQHLPSIIHAHEPDILFFLSGVDILETDKYGKLKITPEGCRQRDELVFRQCHDLHIPVCVAMGGGYSRNISDIVNAHCSTFKSALKKFSL